MAQQVTNTAGGYGQVGTGLSGLAGDFTNLGQAAQNMYGSDLNQARTYGQSLREYNQNLLDTRQSLPFELLGYMSGVTGSLPNNTYSINTPLPNQGDSYGMAAGIAGLGPFGGGSV